MRRLLNVQQAALAAMLGVLVLTVCPLIGSAEEPAAPAAEESAESADLPASDPPAPDPQVADSGWAVSSDEAHTPTEDEDAPEGSAGDEVEGDEAEGEKEPAVSSPRVAEKTPEPLKWVPAGVVKGDGGGSAGEQKPSDKNSDAPDPQPNSEEAAESSKPEIQDEAAPESQAGKASEAGKKSGTSDKPTEPRLAKQPAEPRDPREPAPFPAVIEVGPSRDPSKPTGEGPRSGEPKLNAAEAPKTKPAPTAERGKAAPSVPSPPAVAAPRRPLTRNQRALRNRLRSVLAFYYRRPLNSIDHDPWEVMHNMLAYGKHSRILEGNRRGRPMTAVGFLAYNMPAQQKQMMSLTADGVIETRVAVGMQGHKGQFLAMLAQCGVSSKYPLRVGKAKLTVEDLIRSEQLSCYPGEELTFKLIGLGHYLDLDATWVNDQGETWSFPRLIEEERTQKIRGAACGGTHRLSGLSLAVRKRRELGQPIDGEYAQAKRFVQQYVNYAYSWQNRDGSLSTEWFRGAGDEEDINRRVRTTGHLLEWLLYTIPDDQLTSSQTVRAVSYLTGVLASNTQNPWEIGPLSHALHALALYDERVFQPHDAGLIAAAKRSGRRSASPENLNYRNIDSRVVASMPSSDDAELARAELERRNSGLRGLFGNRRRPTHRSR